MPMMFGPQMVGAPPVGPVPQIDLPSGFRPPGLAMGGLPGMPQQQGMSLGVPYVPGLGGRMTPGPGPNEQAVNKTNDAAGTSDPMAQGAAQVADMTKPGGGVTITETGGMQPPTGSPAAWVARNFPFLKGLF